MILVPCYLGNSASFSFKAVSIASKTWAMSPSEQEKHVRQTIIACATTALVTAIVAIWGTTIIIAHTEKHPEAAAASTSVDVLRMMRDAKGLPEETFDAH
jgi:hypothetical protein